MPSLTIYSDEKLDQITRNFDLVEIELKFNQILVNILGAEEENCQIIWVSSKILTFNYKVYCELKYRENVYEHAYDNANGSGFVEVYNNLVSLIQIF